MASAILASRVDSRWRAARNSIDAMMSLEELEVCDVPHDGHCQMFAILWLAQQDDGLKRILRDKGVTVEGHGVTKQNIWQCRKMITQWLLESDQEIFGNQNSSYYTVQPRDDWKGFCQLWSAGEHEGKGVLYGDEVSLVVCSTILKCEIILHTTTTSYSAATPLDFSAGQDQLQKLHLGYWPDSELCHYTASRRRVGDVVGQEQCEQYIERAGDPASVAARACVAAAQASSVYGRSTCGNL